MAALLSAQQKQLEDQKQQGQIKPHIQSEMLVDNTKVAAPIKKPKFGRVPRASAFALVPKPDDIRDDDIRASEMVVAKDGCRLNMINFRPHLVLELIQDNKNGVKFLLKYLSDAPLKRRHDLFNCAIERYAPIRIMKRLGVPARWLRSCKITEAQRTYMWSIGYTEIEEYRDSRRASCSTL